MVVCTLKINHIETEKSFDPIIGKVDSRFDLLGKKWVEIVLLDLGNSWYLVHQCLIPSYVSCSFLSFFNKMVSYIKMAMPKTTNPEPNINAKLSKPS